MSKKPKIYQPMKFKIVYFAISLSVLIPGIYSLLKYGLQLSVDFTGGSNITWQSENLSKRIIDQEFSSREIEVKNIDQKDSAWEISTEPINRNQYTEITETLKSKYTLTEKEFRTVGPSLGKELIRKTLYSIILAAGIILLYVTYRFKNLKFGVTAILAMLHDTLILLGSFSLLGHFQGVEVDTLFVTAVLTILSFSVHDTIVVYDRIRELLKKHSYLDFEEIVNRAVVETLGRSINNSMTIIFMLLAMYLIGGETIHWFIFALLIGTISGTYSSTFTAAPLLVVWDNLVNRKKGKR